MPAYVIVDIEITDPVDYEEYKKLAPPTIAHYGGKYLARGGIAEILEGDWDPQRLVILEFASIEQAKAWLHSPEYSEIKAIRHRAAVSHMVAIEGL